MPKPGIILFAFKTRLVSERVPSVDALDPPANYKSPETIARWRADQADKLQSACLRQPYTAEFEDVQLADFTRRSKARFAYDATAAERYKPPVCVRVRNYLLKNWPDAWENTPCPDRTRPPQAIFVGFEPRLFLKILAQACSVANLDSPTDVLLPLSMWHGNTDHRDIGEMVKAEEYKSLLWDAVFADRKISKVFADWKGPGENVTADLELAAVLAAQIGLLSRDERESMASAPTIK